MLIGLIGECSFVIDVLVKEYNVPLNQAGYIWNVFKIENGSVVDINNYNADETTMYGEYASEYNY